MKIKIKNKFLQNHFNISIMKDSAKYLKQYAALEEAAKAEIIEILSTNPTVATSISIGK